MTNKLLHVIYLSSFFIFFCSSILAQKIHKLPIYLQTQYSKTLYDRTIGNNPRAIGIGVEGFYQSKSILKPIGSIFF
jgi:hypothetical protein